MPNGLKTVLVIDDDTNFQNSFSDKLKTMGFTVSVADTGDQAVEVFSKIPDYFDLVFLDMLMPDIDGMEIHEVLRIESPAVRILFTSGVFELDYLREILRPGKDGFVIKPFSHTELQMEINKVMNG